MKKLFSLFAALTLSVGLWAINGVKYLDANGQEQTADNVTEVTNASEAVTLGTAGTTTWYIVKGTDVQLSEGAVCAGDVRLILADNAKLTATGDYYDWTPGIQVSGEGNSLTIYAQSTGEQSGQLIATGGTNAAGIGGGYEGSGSNITINGGTITATGNYGGAGIGGGSEGSGSNITINGGTVTATGDDEYGAGAGIGGGVFASGSDITINGGTITATGNYGAAGIGGGGNGGAGSNITINGGEVTATGGSNAAGIGGGYGESGSNITILAGTVTATGGDSGAGIGGGSAGFGSNITISGGKVTANGGSEAAGIGGGIYEDGSDITINGGEVTANGGVDAAGIGGGAYASGSASDIYISDAYVLKAGAAANPTDVIAHSSAQDLGETLTQRYVQFGGLATPYTRTVTANSWGTVCLPYAATSFEGATFYKLNYYNGSDKLYIEEVSALEAGKPYIFEATADGTLTINHSATAPMAYSEAGNEGGLYGSFARTAIESDGDMAAISGGSVVIAGDGNTVTVPACRAYLDMNEVATSEQPHSAPLRCIGVPRQTPTSLDKTLDTKHQTQKLLHNGQFVIIRDGKTYNAQGQIIQ